MGSEFMQRNITIAVLVLAPVLIAGEPAKVEPPKPASETRTTLPTFTASPSEGTAIEEAGDPNVVVLPGAPATSAASPAPVSPQTAAATPDSTPRLIEREDKPPVQRRDPKLPEEFAQDAAVYLQRQMNFWTVADAKVLMGTPLRQRAAIDAEKNEDGDIFAFSDPSSRYREFELDFDRETGRLRSIFVYPWNMKWDDCRRLWGTKVSASQAANGRKFYSYENRNLDVLVDRSGNVISFGLY
jgi:hypothetical protein